MGAPETTDPKNSFCHIVGANLDCLIELALVRSLSEHALTGASVLWMLVSQGVGS